MPGKGKRRGTGRGVSLPPEEPGKAGRGERSPVADAPPRAAAGPRPVAPRPAGERSRALGTGRLRQAWLPGLRGSRRAGAGSAPRLAPSPEAPRSLPGPRCRRPAGRRAGSAPA